MTTAEGQIIIGFAYSIKEVGKIKSVPKYENVTSILFDEFLPDSSRYIRPSDPFHEPTLIMSLYMTIARGFKKVIREDVKLICIGNSVSFYNPYFTYFSIDLTNKESGIFNHVYAERFLNKEIKEEIEKTKFGEILQATPYGKYALGNESLTDTKRNIKGIDKNCRTYLSLYCFGWYTLHYNNDGDLFFTDTYDATFKKKFQMTEPPTEGEQIPFFKGDIFNVVKKVYEKDKLFFNNMKTKANLIGIFK